MCDRCVWYDTHCACCGDPRDDGGTCCKDRCQRGIGPLAVIADERKQVEIAEWQAQYLAKRGLTEPPRWWSYPMWGLRVCDSPKSPEGG